MVKVAFLDRDGTLIKDSGYTFRIDDLMWMPDAIAGLSFLVSIGYKIIVITNPQKKVFPSDMSPFRNLIIFFIFQ